MQESSRRTFIKQASAAAFIGSSALTTKAAFAQKTYTLKYANNLPATHPMNLRAKEMADKIAAESKGMVSIRLFPNSQLGTDTDVLAQVRAGAVDFFMLSPLILGTLIADVQLSNVGFAFGNYDQVWAAMDGKLGAYVRDKIATRSNLFAFEKIWDNGYRNVTTKERPVRTPKDLAGRKIRVMPSAMSISVFRAFGASPVSINWSETYSALQTNVVEGQENPLAVLSTAKIYEVQNYCSLTRHVWDGFWCIGNRKSFERLPADLQEIVRRNVNEAGLNQRKDLQTLNVSLEQELKAQGMKFNDTEQAAFQAQLREAGFYAEWRKKFGDQAWSLLEEYTGRLA